MNTPVREGETIAALYGSADASHSTARIAGFASAVSELCPQHQIVHSAYTNCVISRYAVPARVALVAATTLANPERRPMHSSSPARV